MKFVRLLDLSAVTFLLLGPLHHHLGRGREPVGRMQNVLPMILEPPRALGPQAEKPAPFIGAVEQERHRVLIRSRCALDRIGQHGRYPVVTADNTPNEKAPPGSR